MNVAQTFFLLLWAVIGLCLVLFSPSRRFRKEGAGLPDAEVNALLRQKDERGVTLYSSLLPGWLLELVQTVVVEPAYLLWGLLSHAGQREFGYGALAALLVNVLLGIVVYGIRKARNLPYPRITWFTWIWAFVASLPTLYLWYLFLVVVGVVR